MNRSSTIIFIASLGAIVLGINRFGAAASPSALSHVASTPMPMHSSMPSGTMSGQGMMGGGMTGSNCPDLQKAMMGATAPADHAMMQSMMTMQHAMMTMHLSGNPDRDFMTMMIPHHQAAIDMANVELREGKDPRVIALARNIIKAQEAEIRQMQSWLGETHHSQ